MPKKALNVIKVLIWNIQQGGGPRRDQIAASMIAHNPDAKSAGVTGHNPSLQPSLAGEVQYRGCKLLGHLNICQMRRG